VSFQSFCEDEDIFLQRAQRFFLSLEGDRPGRDVGRNGQFQQRGQELLNLSAQMARCPKALGCVSSCDFEFLSRAVCFEAYGSGLLKREKAWVLPDSGVYLSCSRYFAILTQIQAPSLNL
jgi:hypothetical protein